MRIWRAVQGEGSKLGILARTQSTPPDVVIRDRIRSEEMGWWRDADKLSTNRGKSAVYIPLVVGWLAECFPLVRISLIICTCSSRILLIKHHENQRPLWVTILHLRIWKGSLEYPPSPLYTTNQIWQITKQKNKQWPLLGTPPSSSLKPQTCISMLHLN